jgi:hypothetical protein
LSGRLRLRKALAVQFEAVVPRIEEVDEIDEGALNPYQSFGPVPGKLAYGLT